jgi:Uma2 family endonuclease
LSIAALPESFSENAELPVPAESLKRFTVEEYHAMIDAGVFAEDENYELLEGLIVHKMGKNPGHWIATDTLRDLLQALGIAGYFIHSQNPVTTKESEPEPDVAIVRGKRREYRGGNPDPRKVPLIVEVADSSLRRDRGLKKRIYARARIATYWIVNLIDRQVEIYTQPSGPTKKPDYKQCQIVGEGGELPVMIDGREVGRIKVKDVLP